MIARRTVAHIAVFAVCVTGGFLTAYAWPPPTLEREPDLEPTSPASVLGSWLRLPSGQVRELAAIDPSFARERAELEGELEEARNRLAGLFEDAEASDAAIIEQTERVIAVHDQLERRVATYLLAIRPHLDGQQRAALFDRCAESIREAGGWRWRHGAGARGGGPPTERGPGRRRGQGPPWSPFGREAQSQPVSNEGEVP